MKQIRHPMIGWLVVLWVVPVCPVVGQATTLTASRHTASPSRCGSSAVTDPTVEEATIRRGRTTATFTLSGAGYDEAVTYTIENNLIFCRRSGQIMVWVRLAQDQADDGENGPHIDIDLCNVSAGETFTAMNPRAQPCPGGATWAIWWHDGPDVVFANTLDSSPCTLDLVVTDDTLEGRFSCHDLLPENGTARLDIRNGFFRCTLADADEDGAKASSPSGP